MSRIHYYHYLAYLSDARLIGITCRAHSFACMSAYKCLCRPESTLTIYTYIHTPLALVGESCFLVLFIFSFHSFVRWSVESVVFRFNECTSDMNRAFERVEPMILFTADAATAAATTVVTIDDDDDDCVCVCVRLLSVQA